MDSYRILSVDGGGVRGVLAARLIERVERVRPGVLTDADLFAGTSSGALTAGALACGVAPRAVTGLFREHARTVFRKRLFAQLAGLCRARYSLRPLQAMLEREIGPRLLKDARPLLVVSVCLDSARCPGALPLFPRRWRSRLWHNFPTESSGCVNADREEPLVRVLLRSAAAPTYFPLFDGHVDGGIAANNPAICAVALACCPHGGGASAGAITLLSFGSGLRPAYISGTNNAWGILQWAPRLLDLTFDTCSELTDTLCEEMLDGRYMRVNPILSRGVGLDEAAAVEEMIATADRLDIDPIIRWIDREWGARALPRKPTSPPAPCRRPSPK